MNVKVKRGFERLFNGLPYCCKANLGLPGGGRQLRGFLSWMGGKQASWKAGGRPVGTYNSYILVVQLVMLRWNWEYSRVNE